MATPPGEFQYGVSASAFQTEGACLADGKGASIWDVFSQKRGRIKNGDSAEKASEFYYRFKEDLDLMHEMEIRNFRFSLSWSRILPEGRKPVNQKGIDFYDRLVDECLERNINPWITLYHWDLPQQLENKGGWTNRDTLYAFLDYSAFCLERLSDRVGHWMALNEPLVFTGAGYFLGIHAPGRKGLASFLPAVHHAALAQAEGIRLIQSHSSQLKAGTSFSCSQVSPFRDLPRDIDAANRVHALLNRLFADPLFGRGYPKKELPFLEKIGQWMREGDEKTMEAKPDFIGIQNYTREVVKYAWLSPYLKAKIVEPARRSVPFSVMNWEIIPSSVYEMLKFFNQYPVPEIIISESGIPLADKPDHAGRINDTVRTTYLSDCLEQVDKARQEGLRVKGYFVWSFTDNFEWSEGYYPRFGLVYVDYQTQKRTIKQSGMWYSGFVKINQTPPLPRLNTDLKGQPHSA